MKASASNECIDCIMVACLCEREEENDSRKCNQISAVVPETPHHSGWLVAQSSFRHNLADWLFSFSPAIEEDPHSTFVIG